MVLTAASLSHYLLERGLVSSASLVDGDFHIGDLSRRNRVFRVLRGPHPAYIVKQVKDWKPYSVATLEREARFYSLMRSEPALERLRRFPPRCYAYDADNQVLVLELVPESPLEQHGSTRFSTAYARAVGESLRQWHREACAAADVFRDFHQYTSGTLSFHLQSDDSESGPANAELRRLVKRDAAAGSALDALRQQWQSQTLIHGDMKWGNCLIATNAGSDALPRFVDWEMAGWGDPLWDVAGILQEYLAAWARGSRTAEQVAAPMRAFWMAYGAGDELLERAMGYSAARMIQSAYEILKHEEEMTAPAIRLLQPALNILATPDRAVALFFETV
jgi:aminoglycoside phosphotransferase (APT) family kinase protein